MLALLLESDKFYCYYMKNKQQEYVEYEQMHSNMVNDLLDKKGFSH